MVGSGLTYASQGRPFLRWAGSKSQQVPFLASVVPEFSGRYIEPFAGSAALFFHLSPSSAVLSDSNRDLIKTFEAVKWNSGAVAQSLSQLPLGRDAYYQVRALSAASLGESETAARFIYLNRFCFNGLYRTNREGGFNVPYGRPKTFSLPSDELLEDCSARLASAELHSRDFRDALADAQCGDFVYLDPPYALPNRRSFTSYSPTPFSLSDLAELAELLRDLDVREVTFLLSYAFTSYSRGLFDRWHRRRYTVRRNVAGFGHSRRRHFDLLVSNIPLAD